MQLKAKWIWNKQSNYNRYNDTIIAKKTFKLKKFDRAKIAITADSFYRLYINDQWVNDGPCRSWPEHYQYDFIEVTSHLKQGLNKILVLARYFGAGTFHEVPQQAGLLIQLDIENNGSIQSIFSDENWHVTAAKSFIPNVAKISFQREPGEYYDARLESLEIFSKAKVLFSANNGPWKDLQPRDVALMTKKPFAFKSFLSAKLVKTEGLNFCLSPARLIHPGLIEDNYSLSNECGLATILILKKPSIITIFSEGFRFSIDGKQNKKGQFKLSTGKHLLLAFGDYFSYHGKESTLRLSDLPGLKLQNPIQASHENPFCFIQLEGHHYKGNDLVWSHFPHPERDKAKKAYNEKIESLFNDILDVETLRSNLGNQVKCMSSQEMFVHNANWQFQNRKVLGDAIDLIENPSALMHDHDEATRVYPSPNGDVELAYDFGEQNCGYYDFELIADEGVAIDLQQIEFISTDDRLQHTGENRNGMRFITRKGVNRFLSTERRSGRYLFIILRNQKAPVSIRKVQLIESTYPVNYIGAFRCSDIRLNQIWEISAHTLKLCMEDTFTDCPLYEQTLWVGDARNESLFAYPVFGATDLARRCIRLAGQSLERYPITGCQVPSSWDVLLPAWSFLWGISVWEYYFYSGDKNFLKSTWKWVVKNLKGAEKLIVDRGLFSGPFWNMFDWASVDQNHQTVLQNSMVLVGAIDAALKCADVLGDQKVIQWLRRLRKNLVQSINDLWDPKQKSYPDSIHEDGSMSKSISQHTSFFAFLYDIISPENAPQALRNMLSPPKSMVRVGSPFAMMYLYEALEKAGKWDAIIEDIYKSYLPMLEAGATTVWEVFPTSQDKPKGFPTRSHCHGWSSAPVYFLNQIILGIRQTSVGGKSFEISPYLSSLKSASGTSATIRGPVSVSWQIAKKELHITITAPKGVITKFISNPSHKGLRAAVRRIES